MGLHAARLLMNLVRDQSSGSADMVLKPELVVREDLNADRFQPLPFRGGVGWARDRGLDAPGGCDVALTGFGAHDPSLPTPTPPLKGEGSLKAVMAELGSRQSLRHDPRRSHDPRPELRRVTQHGGRLRHHAVREFAHLARNQHAVDVGDAAVEHHGLDGIDERRGMLVRPGQQGQIGTLAGRDRPDPRTPS